MNRQARFRIEWEAFEAKIFRAGSPGGEFSTVANL
jgi:hypothetical protein